MERKKLTKTFIEKLAPPSDKNEMIVWDSEVKGLGLRVTKSGRKSYILKFRLGSGRDAPIKKPTLAQHWEYPDPADAREKAREWIEQGKQGVDPKQIMKEVDDRETVQSLCEKYITMQKKRGDKRSRHEEERRIKKNILDFKVSSRGLLRDLAVADVTHDHVESLHLSMSDRPVEANRTRAVLSVLFEFAISKNLRTDNPARRVQPYPETSRDRFLDADEIKWFWQACSNTTSIYGTFGQVLLLTGQRRGEIAGMRWDEIDDNGVLTVPAGRRKNKHTLRVYLSQTVRSMLSGIERKGDYVFTTSGTAPINGFSKAKKSINRDMVELAGRDIENWNWHDLRRTFATGMQSIGVNGPVISALQGQQSKEQLGVASIYQRYDFDAEKKHAMEAWSAAIADIALGSDRDQNKKLEIF